MRARDCRVWHCTDVVEAEPGGVIVVTGAGGVLGREVADALAACGMTARGLGRRTMPPGFPIEWARADLLTGEGLRTGLQGVRAVIHCASDPRRPENDQVALGRLMDAMRPTGEAHLIYIGIAGIERAAKHFPYYAAKLACEQALAASIMPHTILRATQFHPLVASVLRHLDLRLAFIAPRGVRLQPVDVAFVAFRLVGYTLSGPAGRTPDVHGPDVLGLDELARSWLLAQGRRRPVISLPLPVQPFRAFAQLQRVSGVQGGLAWRDWLSRRARKIGGQAKLPA